MNTTPKVTPEITQELQDIFQSLFRLKEKVKGDILLERRVEEGIMRANRLQKCLGITVESPVPEIK